MNEELKQIIIGVVVFIIIISIAMYFSGNKNDKDLTSPDNYYNNGREVAPIQ
ncbi:MAG: hypothetical protein WC349_02860 [Patescibacteria group bacterium]|jgi:hypothetical protein